jgi:predicted nucleic acid-binding protein
LIDSNIWIDYFQASAIGKKAVEYIEGKEKIIISALNIAEVYRHVLSKRTKEDAEKAADVLQQFSFIIPVTTEIAKKAAVFKHEQKLGMADAIIYATAEQEHATIITADNDFRHMQNVVVVK